MVEIPREVLPRGKLKVQLLGVKESSRRQLLKPKSQIKKVNALERSQLWQHTQQWNQESSTHRFNKTQM